MVASKRVGKNPRELGEQLAALLPDTLIQSADVAGPGFINLRLNPVAAAGYVAAILERGDALARAETPAGGRINIEFVSVNPNGPITIGSGRGAAYGSTLANVLEAAGNAVHREYYINDGVNSEQMRLFAESVKSYVEGTEFPEKGYRGDYVQDVARALSPLPDIAAYQSASQDMMLKRQREDLAQFGVTFDTWFSEQSLHDAGVVAARIEELIQQGVADTEPKRTKLKLAKGGKIDEVITESQVSDEDDVEGAEPTLWLRSTEFGDDMDRVLRRRDGRLTYIASDIAYHADKFTRPDNAGKLITILGPDHHGYIGRLTAVLAALRYSEASPILNEAELTEAELALYGRIEKRNQALGALALAKQQLEVVIYQLVRFLKEGKPAPMRKRDGNIYELRDLIREIGTQMAPDAPTEEQTRIGRDVSRFFYLMRSADTTMDFDIDLATKNSDENPVFYVQYAHARICSVITKAAEAGLRPDVQHAELLVHDRERALIKKIADLPYEVARIASDYSVHRLTTYAAELARSYHYFYDGCRVIQTDQPELSQARLSLCEAARRGLAQTLSLLGISAPERM
jgi:arginyl-tRNA synthetase